MPEELSPYEQLTPMKDSTGSHTPSKVRVSRAERLARKNQNGIQEELTPTQVMQKGKQETEWRDYQQANDFDSNHSLNDRVTEFSQRDQVKVVTKHSEQKSAPKTFNYT